MAITAVREREAKIFNNNYKFVKLPYTTTPFYGKMTVHINHIVCNLISDHHYAEDFMYFFIWVSRLKAPFALLQKPSRKSRTVLGLVNNYIERNFALRSENNVNRRK